MDDFLLVNANWWDGSPQRKYNAFRMDQDGSGWGVKRVAPFGYVSKRGNTGIPHVDQPAAVLPKCPHNTAHGYGSTRAIDPSKNGCKVGQLSVDVPCNDRPMVTVMKDTGWTSARPVDSPAEMVMTSDPALWVKFMKYCWLWHVMAYFKLPQVSEFIIGYDISGTFGKSSGLLLTISKWVKDVNALQKRSMKMWSVSFSISIDAPFNLFQWI